MAAYDNNEAFFTTLRALIEKWCDRRCLKALNYILGSYIGFNGLTDGWGELRISLSNVRALATTELKPDELEEVNDLIRALDKLF